MLSPFVSYIRYLHLIFIRDRVAVGLMLLPFFITSMCWFLGSTMIFEQGETSFAFMRLALRFGYIFMTVFYLVPFFHDLLKSDDWLMFRTSPLSDGELILGGWICVLEMSLLFWLPVIMSLFSFGGEEGLLSGLKILFEGLIMATFSYFLVMAKMSRLLCLAFTFGFYLLTQMISLFQGLSVSSFSDQGTVFIGRISAILAYVIPELDHLWDQSLSMLAVKSLLFSFLLLGTLRASWQR